MFIEYSKAFDNVSHSALWKSLSDFGAPRHLVWLMDRLYSKATGVIRVMDSHTDQFQFEKGVRQGCIVSPLLFKISCYRFRRHLMTDLAASSVEEPYGISAAQSMDKWRTVSCKRKCTQENAYGSMKEYGPQQQQHQVIIH